MWSAIIRQNANYTHIVSLPALDGKVLRIILLGIVGTCRLDLQDQANSAIEAGLDEALQIRTDKDCTCGQELF